MSTHFDQIRVDLEPGSRQARVRFRVENRSRESWGSKLHLGWQLYDPDTGLFIREGEWQALPEVPSGGSVEQEVTVELPGERGRYHVYISALEESGGWHYQQGWQFLLLEALVESGVAEVVEVRPTTLAALRRSSRWRALKRAFTEPPGTIWRHRGLIRSMVRRDISARYRGSFADALWTILNPLLLMATYFFVFGIVLQSRAPGDDSATGFALYFLAGMLTWLPFSEAVARAPGAVIDHRNFVKKLVFPIEIVPVNLTLSGLVTQGFALVVFLVFLVVARGGVPLSALWLPVMIVPQVLLTMGLCWFLAGLGAYVRDLGQLIGHLLMVWFFITPICYPDNMLPASTMPIMELNPLLILVRGFRQVLLPTEGAIVDWGPIWKLWLATTIVAILGYACFHKLRRSFADVI